jgi:predicted N-acyltransferase
MDFKTFESINTVDPATWNRLTHGHPFAGWQWCQYGETAMEQPGYFLIASEGGEPVGGAIFWVMHKETIPTRNALVFWMLGRYLRWRPLIACRTAVMTDHKGFFLPDDPDRRAAVLDEIRRVGSDLARRHHGSFVLADYMSADETSYEWGDFLKFKDYMSIGTRMAVEWDSFEGYMDRLKAANKKAHKNVRHNLRYAQEEGILIRFQHAPPPVQEVIHLIDIKMGRYKVSYDRGWVRQIIRASTALPEPNAVWVIATLRDRMVGCELLLYDDASRVCKPVLYGRDYDADFVYFYMCYEDIRYAIEVMRASTIIYDTEAYEFKRRIGFTDDPRNNLVVRPNSRLERTLTGWLSGFMTD